MLPCPYFSAAQVKRCLQENIPELVRVLEEGFRNFSVGPKGGVSQPVRSSVPVDGHNGSLLSMPAYSAHDDALATKVITHYPDNSAQPSIQGVVLLFHAASGALKCIMDAVEITAYRTAAASAVATKYLASDNPKILAVLGAGTQAKIHVVVLTTMFHFEQVRIWNHRATSATSLVADLAAEYGIAARYEPSTEAAVRDADVVVTATASPTPILQAGCLKEGAHVNAVGAHRPEWRELSGELMRQSVVYVDSAEAARVESGDVILSGAEVFAEIGHVLLGTKENRRAETTVFKSLGMALEDVLAAELVFRHLASGET